jgi:hypothetical protein
MCTYYTTQNLVFGCNLVCHDNNSCHPVLLLSAIAGPAVRVIMGWRVGSVTDKSNGRRVAEYVGVGVGCCVFHFVGGHVGCCAGGHVGCCAGGHVGYCAGGHVGCGVGDNVPGISVDDVGRCVEYVDKGRIIQPNQQ